jgi:chromodomain-helicase-DNA-binding protein 1
MEADKGTNPTVTTFMESDFSSNTSSNSSSDASEEFSASDTESKVSSPIDLSDLPDEVLELYGIRRGRRAAKPIVESSSEEEEQTVGIRWSSRAQRKNYDEQLSSEDDSNQIRQQKKTWTQEDWLHNEGKVIDRVLDYQKDTFLIKWQGKSHLHNTWETMDVLSSTKGYKKVQNYLKRIQPRIQARNDVHVTRDDLELMDMQDELEREMIAEFTAIERIIDYRQGEEYYVKWKQSDYSDCTWEKAEDLKEHSHLIGEFWKRRKSELVPGRSQLYRGGRLPFKGFNGVQPNYIKGGTLREYQLRGVSWGANLWHRNHNGILADEMGLGKTCQTISILSYLFHEMQIYGPFLVVVPLSTMGSWQNEFQKWAPDMNVVVYGGNGLSRDIIRQHELYQRDELSFNVLLTTYEMVTRNKDFLGQINWKYLAVDEGHRLKNQSSQIHDVLTSFHTDNRLLITGTPLQNNVQELVNLIKFLMPGQFSDLDEMDISLTEGAKAQAKIEEFHARLKPFMCRRLKKDVEKDLPQKTEMILRVELAPLQMITYRNVITRNYSALAGPDTRPKSLLNIVMELKKTSDHPYLVQTPEPQEGKADRLRELIVNSGKMILLDKLLVKLKQDGHRVLIFSQLVMMLDILSEYLTLRGFVFQRLDGSTKSDVRKRSIEHFNRSDSSDFCFLLSTRAGGLGINLETADTVILFDSDWNPQNDLQAMARAHRIGQKNHVNVYRFVSKGTIEEEILERAKRKMVLEYSIMRKMDGPTKKLDPTDAYSREELQAILKFGAQNMFNNQESSNLENMNLDDVLARAEAHNTEDMNEDSEFMSAFQVADVGAGNLDWDSIIPEEERKRLAEEERLEEVRRRQEEAAAKAAKLVKSEKKDRPKSEGKPTEQFGKRDVDAIVKGMRKYGAIEVNLDKIVSDAITLKNKKREEILDCGRRLMEACEACLSRSKDVRSFVAKNTSMKDEPVKVEPHEKEAKTKMVSLEFAGVQNINVANVVERVRSLTTLELELKKLSDTTHFRLASAVKPPTDWACEWKPKDDAMLLLGLSRHGMGSWEAIIQDDDLGLSRKMFLKDELDASGAKKLPGARNLVTRAETLLKALQEHGVKKRTASDTLEDRFAVKRSKHSPPPSKHEKHKSEKHSEKKSEKKPEKKVEKAEKMLEPGSQIQHLMKPVQDLLQGLKKGLPADKAASIKFLKDTMIPIHKHVHSLLTGGANEQALWEYVNSFWWTKNTWEKVKQLADRLATPPAPAPVQVAKAVNLGAAPWRQ